MSEVQHANVYEAFAAAFCEVGYVQRTGRITSGPAQYRYAGEAEFIAEIRPALAKHGLFLIPSRVVSRETTEGATRSGAASFTTRLTMAYTIYHESGGDSIHIETAGEGADTGDKDMPKAMTNAYKYALRQAFCIETGDDPDDTPSEQYERPASSPRQQPPKPQPKPAAKAPDHHSDEVDHHRYAAMQKSPSLAERMGEMVPEARPAPAVPVFAEPKALQAWAVRELKPQNDEDKAALWARFWQAFRSEMDRAGCVGDNAAMLLGVARETMGDDGIYRVAQQAVKDALR
jgi:hypothetical protein